MRSGDSTKSAEGFFLKDRANSLPLLAGGICLIAISSFVCVALRIPTETRLWEFPIDFKLLAALAVASYSIRGKLRSYLELLGLRKWNWSYLLSAFCAPVVLLLCVICVGYLSRAVEFQGVENTLSFCLSGLLDLPALFFFSMTTMLVEEAIFRGLILRKLSEGRTYFSAVAITSLLWAALRITDSQNPATALFSSALPRFLYFMAYGILLAQGFLLTRSIWVTYSFRIGMTTFSSFLLTSSDSDANSLFVATSPQFDHRGLAMAGLFCICAFVLSRLPHLAKKPQHL